MVLVTIESKESDFEVYFKDPIKCEPNYVIGLLGATMWYSYHNISKEYGNNTLKYTLPNQSTTTITFPDGNYDADNLNHYLEDLFECTDDCIIKFDVNTATNRFLIILGDTIKIDLREGKLHELLGFEAKEYSDNVNIGKNIANITRDVDRLLINCSIVNQSYQNDIASDIIYSFSPTTSPGSLINVEPYQAIYLPIIPLDYIHSLRIRVTDQLNRPVNFHGENLTFVFEIK